MKKLIICLLVLGLNALQTVLGQHVNTDPAPGRSPGPPVTIITPTITITTTTTATTTIDSNTIVITSTNNNNNNNNNNNKNNKNQLKNNNINNNNDNDYNCDNNNNNNNKANDNVNDNYLNNPYIIVSSTKPFIQSDIHAVILNNEDNSSVSNITHNIIDHKQQQQLQTQTQQQQEQQKREQQIFKLNRNYNCDNSINQSNTVTLKNNNNNNNTKNRNHIKNNKLLLNQNQFKEPEQEHEHEIKTPQKNRTMLSSILLQSIKTINSQLLMQYNKSDKTYNNDNHNDETKLRKRKNYNQFKMVNVFTPHTDSTINDDDIDYNNDDNGNEYDDGMTLTMDNNKRENKFQQVKLKRISNYDEIITTVTPITTSQKQQLVMYSDEKDNKDNIPMKLLSSTLSSLYSYPYPFPFTLPFPFTQPLTSTTEDVKTTKTCQTQLNDFLFNTDTIIDIDTMSSASNTTINSSNDNKNHTNGNSYDDKKVGQTLKIQLQLFHDIFETTSTAFGLSCGLLYKVRLTAIIPIDVITTINLPMTTSSSSHSYSTSYSSTFNASSPSLRSSRPQTRSYMQSHFSSNANSNINSRNSSNINEETYIYNELFGDFQVESVSFSNSKERGSFVKESRSQQLPYGRFNLLTTLQHRNWKQSKKNTRLTPLIKKEDTKKDFMLNDQSVSMEEQEDYTTQDYKVNRSAETKRKTKREKYLQYSTVLANTMLSDSDNSPNMNKSFKLKSISTTTIPLITKASRIKSHNDDVNRCAENKWQGTTKSTLDTTNKHFTIEANNLWTLNELCSKDDIIVFNVFFRIKFTKRPFNLTDNNVKDQWKNIEQQDLIKVYRKSFQFRIHKDCQLLLKDAIVGALDYTMLPLHSINCTIYFPQHDDKMISEEAYANAPSGLLVELQRLNVPCNGGGYVQFLDRSILCGKLEELNDTERTYHFDIRQQTTVQLYKNPMFSLTYKLVDYCYNVSTSHQQGEYYVRSTSAATLECYFRIHVPYGNRILLRLVTNNDSSIVTSLNSFQPLTSQGNVVNIDNTRPKFVDNQYSNYMIITSGGVNVNVEVINLTLTSTINTYSEYNLPSINMARFLNYNTTTTKQDEFNFLKTAKANLQMDALSNTIINCMGLIIKVFEKDRAKWSYCLNNSHEMRGFILESNSNTLNVHLYRPLINTVEYDIFNNIKKNTLIPTIYLSYKALPIREIILNCAFGWVAMQQFCITIIEIPMTWNESEQHCIHMGGHLVSIRNEEQQQIINQLILNSPNYDEQLSYWVGGSDQNYEGDFRWSDELLFQYTNWFPGWPQYGNYNKQPNDDGLSNQDCIELRRYFHAPLGIQTKRNPLTKTYMWNDRDCNARNFAICEIPLHDVHHKEALPRSWQNDCNKTVSLTKEHPRASIWSPSFPRQYPDNVNCFTIITAPNGYRIVIEFEELVIESEPGCTYDYLEILEPDMTDNYKTAYNQERNFFNNYNENSNNIENDEAYEYNLNNMKSSNDMSKDIRTNYLETNIYNESLNNIAKKNYDNSKSVYKNFYKIYSTLQKRHVNTIIRTPDFPHGNPYYRHNTHNQLNNISDTNQTAVLPQRLCGDWSTKLKLLRYVSTKSFLGLHFVSDYSHHFDGYKAKTYMENTASECANERLKSYNGSCYLFVSYPEVDWWTAQQICRGMGAKLTSIASTEEHRFVTSNIRNQMDYSPQLIYWLGAELEKNGEFEWTDDTKMNFQGWLPGYKQYNAMPMESICLGLQWKMSPTPMLASGLYWQAQRCNKVGGYICKMPKESLDYSNFNNFTITGTEGRLISPGYPNTYPLNVDYWVHIKGPPYTRIILQFQKIDLEAQDECLYDYISIHDYDIDSKLILEPGINSRSMIISLEKFKMNEYSNDDHKANNNNENSAETEEETVDIENENNDENETNNEKLIHYKLWHPLRKYIHIPNKFKMYQNHLSRIKNSRYKRNSRYKSIYYSNSKVNHKGNSRKYQLRTTRRMSNKKFNKYKQKYVNCKNISKKSLTHVNPCAKIKKDGKKMGKSLKRKRRNTVLSDNLDNAQSFLPYVRWCGSHDSNMSKFDFVSTSNEVILNFHSDYSTPGLGFAAIWKAVDVSPCPQRTLTSREGIILSPNYPHFLLNNLNCVLVIQAPVGRRVWLEFLEYDFRLDSSLEVDVGNGFFRPFQFRNHLNDGMFVSLKEQVRIQFQTGQQPRGKGFQARYYTVGQMERRERVVNLGNETIGHLYQLNYPDLMPDNIDYVEHIVAPFGYNILLELHGVKFSENGCQNGNLLEIIDNYADTNGTKWQLCKYQITTNIYKQDVTQGQRFINKEDVLGYNSYETAVFYEYFTPPIFITSYLNTLYIRQRNTANTNTTNLNCTVHLQLDNDYKMKLATGFSTVESCYPNPCQFNGKCLINNNSNYCQCYGHYTGRFCGLNLCELEPCIFGKCILTPESFKCKCQTGYTGLTCEQKQRPCADNPCEGRGICHERNGGFYCRCYAWWEGPRCDKRMLHIPYKPLSERMFQEPFWLGLITVFVVLAVIALVWCAKRHFPEKIEKLLAEEAERNRPAGSIHGHHHHTSLREQLQFTTAIPQTTVNNAPGATRSLFNRLGIRKPSILSLSSPNPLPGGGGSAARTFSLDDLLRPPPRRSPSPRKRRNNSTPIRTNIDEKKQILQQLISPAKTYMKPKENSSELISMSESYLSVGNNETDGELKETKFLDKQESTKSPIIDSIANDPKLEKKVTFARLLSKVSAEMSSCSEPTRNSSAFSLPTDLHTHPNSTPPSPCINDIRSSQNTLSIRGSDSLSSSDLALTDFGFRSVRTSASEISSNNHHTINGTSLKTTRNSRTFSSTGRAKVSSADSILAMFRNIANANTTASDTITSVIVSPSLTPSVLSPQDDIAGDDESSTSSIHTSVSFTSGPSDSPLFYRQKTTIEVPVLDVMNAHKNPSSSSPSSSSSTNTLHPPTILLEIPSSGINNKCLSPIREMPTPMPSPALTPIMPRPQRSNSPIFQIEPSSDVESTDDEIQSDYNDDQLTDHITITVSNKAADICPKDTTVISETNENVCNDKLNNTLQPILMPMPTLVHTKPDSKLTTPSDEKQIRPRDLVIPMLTVEQPSPTKAHKPIIIIPGSPPPQRASIGETSFMFPNKEQQKRLLKQFEKPTCLEHPFMTPMITVTSNMSELESDIEPLSPAIKIESNSNLAPPNPTGMSYLSPFTICTRADRTISESNLSSSGYSSMASPGPSRCGSNNPLYPNEMDESGNGNTSTNVPLHMNLLGRRKNSILPSCKENITNGKSTDTAEEKSSHTFRLRSDSETYSDDIVMESNDEGISTDQTDYNIDEKKDFIKNNVVAVEVSQVPITASTNCIPQMAQLQLPSIIIQLDGNNEKVLSPVSSRSESPLSERASIKKFSTHFYGRKDQLPFTDSDGLYDFPSSDGKGTSNHNFPHQRRSNSKKRERKLSKCTATQSPTRQIVIPLKDSVSATATPGSSVHVCTKHCYTHHHTCPANTITQRKSPKRRLHNRYPIANSSSSSESLSSIKELNIRQLPKRFNSPNRDKKYKIENSLSEDDGLKRHISSNMFKESELQRPNCKLNRLRAIGNQIRFLRRLEKSMKTRERVASPTDSYTEENTDEVDSLQASSPLLQQLQQSKKTNITVCRQKRSCSGSGNGYGVTTAMLTTNNWKGMERSLMRDNLNSD